MGADGECGNHPQRRGGARIGRRHATCIQEEIAHVNLVNEEEGPLVDEKTGEGEPAERDDLACRLPLLGQHANLEAVVDFDHLGLRADRDRAGDRR